MACRSLQTAVEQQLTEIRASGLYKVERQLLGPQGSDIRVTQPSGPGQVINLCANNYLGLANHPELIRAAREGLDRYGYGMASVRFICGTQDLHKSLERALSEFFGTGDTILYSSCFDANTGLFETLLDERDAVISDALNHASLIDGIRLCKARRLRYAHSDMKELEAALQDAASARIRMIATDGVFSMDGDLARLDVITQLAGRYDAAVVVDDSHATGLFGKGGRGTPDVFGVAGKIDLITSTLGKALGGASGGFTTGPAQVIELLRQRSRPYLFSNALPPPIVAAALRGLQLVAEGEELRTTLHGHATYLRAQLTALGFTLGPSARTEGVPLSPIIPLMLGDAVVATHMADRLLQEGLYVIAFSYPVVPKGLARIRLQLSAAHTRAQLDRALAAFAKVGRELGVLR
jgi:glycine C-acetyltransferase